VSARGGSRSFAGGASTPGVFSVKSYGAKGDGTTDDTAAINAAVAAAYAYATANRFYARVEFDPRTYLVNGPLTQGGATKGNAIIPLPIVATTGQKVVLEFRGAGDASSLPHWETAAGNQTGTVLKTTLTGTNHGTYGQAAVIGGPNPAQGYGAATRVFSNMLVIIDGIDIMAPNNPSICGVDLAGVAEAKIGSHGLSFLVDAGPTTISLCQQDWQFGLRLPEGGNNALVDVAAYSCEGAYFPFVFSEHTVATSVRSIYCVAGLTVGVQGANAHCARIMYACVEACSVGIDFLDSMILQIDCLDMEWGSGAFGLLQVVYDPNNRGTGYIYANLANTNRIRTTDVVGGSGLTIIDLNMKPGSVTAPAMPSSATPTLNPFFRTAAAVFSGGTVSAIKVGGQTLGITSGLVMIPANTTYELVYTVAPTSQVWTLL
jgi:hypothetical protein